MFRAARASQYMHAGEVSRERSCPCTLTSLGHFPHYDPSRALAEHVAVAVREELHLLSLRGSTLTPWTTHEHERG